MGIVTRPHQYAEIVEVAMHRWTLVAVRHVSVHDLPELEELFKDQGPIRRWATDKLLVFSSRSMAFILPHRGITGTQGYAVRSLTQDEIDDPVDKFADILMQVQDT